MYIPSRGDPGRSSAGLSPGRLQAPPRLYLAVHYRVTNPSELQPQTYDGPDSSFKNTHNTHLLHNKFQRSFLNLSTQPPDLFSDLSSHREYIPR